MAKRAILKETIKKNTTRDMKKLGTFKAEYEPLIDIYAELREQYERLTAQYKESGYEFESSTSQGVKKAPIVTTLEALRKDILAYSDRLCLNPKAIEGVKAEKASRKTKLEKVLSKM